MVNNINVESVNDNIVPRETINYELKSTLANVLLYVAVDITFTDKILLLIPTPKELLTTLLQFAMIILPFFLKCLNYNCCLLPLLNNLLLVYPAKFTRSTVMVACA